MIDIAGLVDARNAMTFSAILMSGALFPDAAASLSADLARSWKLLRTAARCFTNRKKAGDRPSFWEIDMTKLEP